MIGIIVWIECQIDTGIIGVTVRCWQVLANDRRKMFADINTTVYVNYTVDIES